MAASVSCGTPIWVDYAADTSANPLRTYDIGTRVQNVGTAAANQVAAGVFPGGGGMQVTPGSGLAVLVAAGYCCVPNSTSALQGGYVFGPVNQVTLTLASADPTNPRIDLAVARVYDVGTSASFCDVEIVTGTPASPPSAPSLPANSLLLAQVSVVAGAATLTSSAITDERSYVVAPGGVLPISSPSAAPAVPSSQVMLDLSSGSIVLGTGTAGTVTRLPALPWAPVLALSASAVSDSSSKGSLTTVATAAFTADGVSDIEVYYKWPGLKVSSAPLLVTLQVALDGTTLDQVVAYPSSSSVYTAGGSARYWTSSGQGNTPSAGSHTVTFAFQSASASATTTMSGAATGPAALRVSPAPG